MSTRYLFLTALLGLGCAHGKTDAHTARAGDLPRHESAADQHAAAPPHRGDSVEVPRARGDRGRLAHAGGTLPEPRRDQREQGRASAEHSKSAAPTGAEAYGTQADNTRVNERDREGVALTPLDQGENEQDR